MSYVGLFFCVFLCPFLSLKPAVRILYNYMDKSNQKATEVWINMRMCKNKIFNTIFFL